MVKDDYIMRMIHEMIQAVLTLLLGRDTESKRRLSCRKRPRMRSFKS